MELLYNPEAMPEEEIKATFVAHQWLVDELISLIERQPDGAGVQHVLIIAPRGMGKTTVLLMVKFAAKDRCLTTRWQVVKFPEESYGVYDLADFWLEALTLIAHDTNDEELRQRAEQLRAEYPDNEDLQEAALAMIKDWRRKHKKRLVLLVDNLDIILEQINDERDNARLREVLMNDGTMMMIGGATTFFHEARAYDQPLYNFFKVYDLRGLNHAQVNELLRCRAAVDKIQDFEEKLKTNESRIRALEYFTGGNPRLVLMLYRVVAHSDLSEVRRGLEKLLDQVTPYFKAKTETLPPQQRKILDHIARESAKTRGGLMPTEIAQATRLTANQVSAQLRRLSELGYLRAANLRERSSYYTLSEPLYAIWYQMRFGRKARQRMQWLVSFLKVYYQDVEFGTECARLEACFRDHLGAGRMHEARDALEHRLYLVYAMEDSPVHARIMDGIVRGFLDMKDTDTLKKDVLTTIAVKNLSNETLSALYEAGCISEREVGRTIGSTPSSAEPEQQGEAAATYKLGFVAFSEGRMDEALQHFNRALEIEPDMYQAWHGRGVALHNLGRYEEAIISYNRALALESGNHEVWYYHGNALRNLGRYEEAIVSHDRALEIKPDMHEAWHDRGIALGELHRYEEAVSSYDRALEIKSDKLETWLVRAHALAMLGRYEKALASLERVLETQPNSYEIWLGRGILLNIMSKHKEAIASIDRGLEFKPESPEAWTARGNALLNLNRYEEALGSFDRTLVIKPDQDKAWLDRAVVLTGMGRYEEALASCDRVLEISPELPKAWFLRGVLLSSVDRHEEALASFNRTLGVKPNMHEAWYYRGIALANLGKYEEALASFDQALEINSGEHKAWVVRGMALDNLGRREEAVASYDRALEINPNEYQVWFSRGLALSKSEKYEEAIASYNRALEIKPNLHEAWYRRGAALSQVGKYEEAIASYDHALEIEPSLHDALLERGIAQGMLGRYEEALDNFKHTLKITPDSHDAWLNLGVAHGMLGKYEEALDNFEHALKITPDSHDAWYNRGIALSRLGKYEEAIAGFDRALEVKPDSYKAWRGRGDALVNLGKSEEAIASFDRALEMKPEVYETWYNRGVALFNLGKNEDAIISFDRALDLNPEAYEAWRNRGSALNNIGKYEEAIASYDHALEVDSGEWQSRTITYLLKLFTRINQKRVDLARYDWNEALSLMRQVDNWHLIALIPLLTVAQVGHLEFVRQLIKESELEEPLFPFTRAIDYLLTGDEALVEKLSPEVRGIVEEIVGKLREATNQAEQLKSNPRGRKVKPVSQRRTAKQLR
jgi:superkiller protein 3